MSELENPYPYFQSHSIHIVENYQSVGKSHVHTLQQFDVKSLQSVNMSFSLHFIQQALIYKENCFTF